MNCTTEYAFGSGDSTEFGDSQLVPMFEGRVAQNPDTFALEIDGRTLTYRELNDRANRLAHHLRRHGVGPNVLVGVSLERSFDMVVAIYGILKAGGAYVPLDPAYPVERLRYMISSVSLQYLVSHSDSIDRLGELVDTHVVLMDQSELELQHESSVNPEILTNGDHLIYAIFTSGSTGQPKAAGVYHRGFVNLIHWFLNEFKITSDDHTLLVSSLSFDLTQKNLFAVLIAGGTLHLKSPGPYDVKELTRLIHDRGITLLNCTPSAFYPLIEPLDDRIAFLLASLRVVFLGGEPISVARVKTWLSLSECRAEIANTYGPTECTDICGFYRLGKDNLDQYEFVPLGRPISNVQIIIVDSKMDRCAVGESGELCVAGAGVGAGYLNDAEMTRNKFVEHAFTQRIRSKLYRTGDIARWHADGVIEYLGRGDHQVKIRGYRIELAEVEKAMEDCGFLKEAIVIVKEAKDNSDPQLVGCYTTHGPGVVSVTELRTALQARLPEHMIPSHFESFEFFPWSPNGKVDRQALAENVSERHSREEKRMSSAYTSLEQIIRSAWCIVLGREDADLDANFFDLGGDSIRLVRLHQKLEVLLEKEFPLIQLFAYPTIRSMAQYLSDDHKGQDGQASIRDRARLQRESQGTRRRVRG